MFALTQTYPTPTANATFQRTLDARLAAMLREGPIRLSAQELADLLIHPGADRRAIQRALRRIRRTYAGRYAESMPRYGRAWLTPTRQIMRAVHPPPGGSSADLSLNPVDLRIEDVKPTGRSDHRVRARDPRPRPAPPKRPPPRAQRIHAHPLPVHPTPPSMRAVPVPEAGEGGVWAALRVRWPLAALGPVWAVVQAPGCVQHPVETSRALRTLVERDTDVPVALFRELLRAALAGDMLVDGEAEAARTRLAEAAARARYAWERDNPATHWPELIDPEAPEPGPDPPPPPREPTRNERIHAARLAALDPLRPRSVPSTDRAVRFLELLTPETAAALARVGVTRG